MHTLEQTSRWNFSYQIQDLAGLTVTQSVEASDMPTLLAALLRDQPLDYQVISEGFVVLARLEAPNPLLQRFCGQVVDAETGEPLPWATLFLRNGTQGTNADEEGRFDWRAEASPSDTLVLSYAGYQRKYVEVGEFLSKGCLVWTLSPTPLAVTTVHITDYLTDGINLVEEGRATQLLPRKMADLPGQVEADVLRSIQFLPGVNSPNGELSQLYIRGGAPDQNLILWEDIPVYHSTHFFGMVSGFNPEAIGQARVYRGGFDAANGNRIAGVIDMGTLVFSPDEGPQFGAGINGLLAHTEGITALGKEQKLRFSYSLRHSIHDVWETATYQRYTQRVQQGILFQGLDSYNLPASIQIDNQIRFWDGQVTLNWQPSPKDELNLALMASRDAFQDSIFDQRNSNQSEDSLFTQSQGVSLRYRHEWNPRWRSEVLLVGSQYQEDYQYAVQWGQGNRTSLDGLRYNRLAEYQWQLNQRYLSRQGWSLNAGYQGYRYEVGYNIRQWGDGVPRLAEGDDYQSLLHVGYFTWRPKVRESWGGHLGLRYSYFGIKKRSYWEPRADAWLRLGPGLILQGQVGQYFQFVSQLVELRGEPAGIDLPIWLMAADATDPVLAATHGQIGLLWQPVSWVIDLQVYHKQLKGLTSLAYGFDVSTQGQVRYHVGDGIAQGMDLLVKKRWPHYSSWLSYSLSRVNYYFQRFTDSEFPAAYDQRHQLSWVNVWNYQGFEASLGWYLRSGLPYTEIVDFSLQTGPEPGSPPRPLLIFEEYLGERLSPQHHLDATIRYNLPENESRRWRLSAAIGVMNLYNRKNPIERGTWVEMRRGGIGELSTYERYDIGITPNFSLQLGW